MSVSKDQMQQVFNEYLHTSLAFSNLLDRVEELERRLREHGWMGEEGAPINHCRGCGTVSLPHDALYCPACVQWAMVGTD